MPYLKPGPPPVAPVTLQLPLETVAAALLAALQVEPAHRDPPGRRGVLAQLREAIEERQQRWPG